MPIEGVVNRIEDLDPRWPRNADIVREGAQHLRNIKTALRQGEEDQARFVQLFWGTVQEIPAGWVVCDGQNGTPDMRNRVPVGAGDQYALGDSGGANSVALTKAQMPVHGHTGTAEEGGEHGHTATENTDGEHSHTGAKAESAGNHRHRVGAYSGINVGLYRSEPFESAPEGGHYSDYAGAHEHTVTIPSGGGHTHGITVAEGGVHSHVVTVGDTGGGEGHENRMPYRALYFIMKLAS